jgi:hypothetical protein
MRVACKVCGDFFDRPVQRGRPAVRCEKCRNNSELIKVHSAVQSLVEGNAELSSKINNAPVLFDKEEAKEEVVKKSYEKYDSNFPYPFRVVVTNLGLAYACEEESEATKAFHQYAKRSDEGFGQVGLERVQLWKLNVELNQYEILKNFIPDRSA